jgi:aminoglycoside 3-N-acetyltransferase
MAIEVHTALHSFGYVERGAISLIEALMQVVDDEGAILMPSFRLSTRQPLNDMDKKSCITEFVSKGI